MKKVIIPLAILFAAAGIFLAIMATGWPNSIDGKDFMNRDNLYFMNGEDFLPQKVVEQNDAALMSTMGILIDDQDHYYCIVREDGTCYSVDGKTGEADVLFRISCRTCGFCANEAQFYFFSGYRDRKAEKWSRLLGRKDGWKILRDVQYWQYDTAQKELKEISQEAYQEKYQNWLDERLPRN